MSSRLLPLVTLIVLLLLASSPDAAAGRSRNFRFPARPKLCCMEVSTEDISHAVTGTTYRRPSAKKPCVNAIILKTDRGSVCVDPTRKWVSDIIANMREE
ncbi:C-C motif chemokine 2-like [Nelusetta ayraudi]|uniref:C-C motif chemokine 2-like n=1 Tax=Nelusetta ayraudi TaxID=303726 RepID=UPI003F7136EF